MKRAIGTLLKARAKAQNLTQAEIAKIAKVSLPTVKRWFSGKGLDLGNLEMLLELLGLTLGELAALLDFRQSHEFEFTVGQEKAMVQDPSLLAYLDQLMKGNAPKKIEQAFQLSKSRSSSLLRTLEKLGLLERLPEGRLKLLVQGQPRWKEGGPLAQSLKKQALEDFLSGNRLALVRLGMHEINPDDYKRLESMLVEVQSFARIAESRARAMPDKPIPIGFLAGLAPFQWKVLGSISER